MLRVAEHFERTDTGRARRENEDSYFARPPLFAVADGMGGAQAGEVASGAAVEGFDGGLPDGPGSVEERLVGLVSEANSRIHALAQGDDSRAGMGTTLTAAYLDEQELSIAHVGDSRLYCLRDGTLEQRTDDHSLVGELVRRGQLSPEEAEDHPQRSIITRALGPESDVQVDHHTWPARDGDIFLICSDGLTSMIGDDQVGTILTGASSLAEAGRKLIEAANEAGGRDNITVILFRVEEVVAGATAEPATREEQATGVGESAPRTDEVRAAVAEAEATSTVAPRAPREPSVAAEPARQRRRGLPTFVKAGFVLGLLAFAVGSGLWIATRAVFFVGTTDEGFVALYQGLPYELPGGMELYSQQFETGVPASGLSAGVRRTVTAHDLRSQEDAQDLVRAVERGELAGQR